MYGVAVSVRLSRQSSQQSAVSSRIGDNSAQWGVTPWVAWSVVGGSPIFPQKIIALLGTGAQRGPLGAQVKRRKICMSKECEEKGGKSPCRTDTRVNDCL